MMGTTGIRNGKNKDADVDSADSGFADDKKVEYAKEGHKTTGAEIERARRKVLEGMYGNVNHNRLWNKQVWLKV